MKNLLFAILFLAAGTISAQQVVTSEEEYNYLTKGYAISLQTGQDIKKGYEIEKFFERSAESFQFSYYFFKEIESKKTKAILVIVKKEKGKDDKVNYICIPFNNKDLMKRSFQERGAGITMSMLFENLNYVLLSKTLDLLQNNPTGKIE